MLSPEPEPRAEGRRLSRLSAGLGRRARVVLGAFVGYSEGDPFIDVWG